MISPELKKLLDFIGSKEAPKGYGQIFGGAKGVGKVASIDVSIMPLNSVLALQKKMLDGKSASTACGRYQFLRKTLVDTMKTMGLTGKEIWTPDLQDRMAVQLMIGRGLEKYLDGEITAEGFANRLAMEWASLPVVSAITGSEGFVLKPGMSYYEGDGLNAALHNPGPFLMLVKALRTQAPAVTQPAPPTPVSPPPPVVEPAPQPPATARPTGLWARLKAWLGWA